jgi:hypothetical protein
MPTVFREAPNFPITLPITGQFLALAAPATSPTPLATGRIALRQANRSVSMSLHRAFEILHPAESQPCAPAAVLRQQPRKAVRAFYRDIDYFAGQLRNHTRRAVDRLALCDRYGEEIARANDLDRAGDVDRPRYLVMVAGKPRSPTATQCRFSCCSTGTAAMSSTTIASTPN